MSVSRTSFVVGQFCTLKKSLFSFDFSEVKCFLFIFFCSFYIKYRMNQSLMLSRSRLWNADRKNGLKKKIQIYFLFFSVFKTSKKKGNRGFKLFPRVIALFPESLAG